MPGSQRLSKTFSFSFIDKLRTVVPNIARFEWHKFCWAGFNASDWMTINGYSSPLSDSQTAELIKTIGGGPYMLKDQCSPTSGRFKNSKDGWVKGKLHAIIDGIKFLFVLTPWSSSGYYMYHYVGKNVWQLKDAFLYWKSFKEKIEPQLSFDLNLK